MNVVILKRAGQTPGPPKSVQVLGTLLRLMFTFMMNWRVYILSTAISPSVKLSSYVLFINGEQILSATSVIPRNYRPTL